MDASTAAPTDTRAPALFPAAPPAVSPRSGRRAPYVVEPIWAGHTDDYQAYFAPVAVIGGTRTVPHVDFVTFDGCDDALERAIRALPRIEHRTGTIYRHPIHGEIHGAIRAHEVPAALLRGCVLDVWTATRGGELDGIREVSSLTMPLVTAAADGQIDIWPRLAGYDRVTRRIPAGTQWVRGQGHWTGPASSILAADATLRPGFIVADPNILIDAQRTRYEHAEALATTEPGIAARVGSALDPIDVEHDFAQLIAQHGDIPDWFGMDLFAYQRTAPPAMVAGHGLLADEPGTGKSVMALAAASLLKPRRVIVGSPAVALTHWVREATRTGILEHLGPDGDERGEAVKIVSGRKQPDLPDAGIVVVTPTLMERRDGLLDALKEWGPDLFIYDEAHGSKTWDSKVSIAMRSLAGVVRERGGRAFALTGTPIFQSPGEAAALLDITGHLETVFGGYAAYMESFCRRDKFNRWQPRASEARRLAEMLDRYCWVRRTKAQVQKDLPPKLRSAQFVDVAPRALVDAHAKVLEWVNEWLDDFTSLEGRLPDRGEVRSYAKSNIGLSSPLREATGMAKIPAAVELVADWAASTSRDDGGAWERPLIVWAHHNVVLDALIGALKAKKIPHGALLGGTGAEKMGEIAAEFQAGKWPVIVASIHAAGVGVTLTRSSDELFVESDWTPAIISQAESRAHRHGQERPVLIRTLIAPGTIDLQMQTVQRKKSKLLLAMTPDADLDTAVIREGDEVPGMTAEIAAMSEPADVVAALVDEAIAARSKG